MLNKSKTFKRNTSLGKILNTAFSTYILSSLLIFVGIIYIEYYIEYKKYYNQQEEELKLVENKINLVVKNLEKLLNLATQRIEIYDNPEDIQKILRSLNYFSSRFNIPPLQQVSYYQYNPYRTKITRFGIEEWDKNNEFKLEKQRQGSHVEFKNNKLKAAAVILSKDKILGVLQIQVNLDDLYLMFDPNKTIVFTSNKDFLQIKSKPISIYSIPFSSFIQFTYNKIDTYIVLFLCMLLGIIFSMIIFIICKKHYTHKYEEIIGSLNSSLQNDKEIFLNINKEYLSLKEKYKNFEIANNSIKIFYSRLLARSKEYIESLDAKFIENKEPKENINIKPLIENAFNIFADIIYQQNISISINCRNDILYRGDSLLIEHLFINILGKIIYRLPRNGEIEIKVCTKSKYINININDNGYSLANISRKNLKNSFPLIIDDLSITEICKENQIFIKKSSSNENQNNTKIIIPKPQHDVDGEKKSLNVIKLFN